MILVRRAILGGNKAGPVRAHRFRNQAANLAASLNQGFWSVVVAWFSATWFHRGCLAVPVPITIQGNGREGKAEAAQVLLATAHLQTGVHNQSRFEQVREMDATLRAWACKAGCAAMILGVDSNADASEPEMKLLRRPVNNLRRSSRKAVAASIAEEPWVGTNWEDSFLACVPDPANSPHGGNTWDNKNPLTAGNLREPDQRNDFILVTSRKCGTACGNKAHALPLQRPRSVRLAPISSRLVLDSPGCDSDHYGVLSVFGVGVGGCM